MHPLTNNFFYFDDFSGKDSSVEMKVLLETWFYFCFQWCCNLRLRLVSAGHACVLYGRSCSLVILCFLTFKLLRLRCTFSSCFSSLFLSLDMGCVLAYIWWIFKLQWNLEPLGWHLHLKVSLVLMRCRLAPSIGDTLFWSFIFASVLDYCLYVPAGNFSLNGVYLLEYYQHSYDFHLVKEEILILSHSPCLKGAWHFRLGVIKILHSLLLERYVRFLVGLH